MGFPGSNRVVIGIVGLIALVVVIFVLAGGIGNGGGANTAAQFPPTSLDEAKALADSASASPPILKRSRLYAPDCECSLFVQVPAGVGRRETAARMLKALFDNNLDGQLDDYGDGGHVIVFGMKGAVSPGGYTAGRIELTLDSGVHTMTIDVGPLFVPGQTVPGYKEYSFTY